MRQGLAKAGAGPRYARVRAAAGHAAIADAAARDQVLEETRADLRQRAEAEAGTLRRERDELRAALEGPGEAAAEPSAAASSPKAGQSRRGRRAPGKGDS
jgi:hypothetical protein